METPHPSRERWTAVDAYLSTTLVGDDALLTDVLTAQNDAGLPPIEVAPVSAKLLSLLVRISGAKRVLEIGTLGGYSTIWLARAVPEDGHVVTIDADPDAAEVARRNFHAAGVSAKIEIRIGRAEDILPALARHEPFDLIFIDADKQSNALYLDWAARLGHPGTVIIVDNVVRSGEVANPDSDDVMVAGTQAGLELLGRDPRFDATALQTLDRKGWDGVALAVLTDAVSPASDH